MSGTINHVKTSTVANDTVNTYLIQPQDWNSVHAYTMQDCISLSGNNTAGTLTAINGSTCYLAGGNNIILSQNANSITISAANPVTLSQWPAVLPGSTAFSTYTIGNVSTSSVSTSQTGYTFSIFFVPMVLQDAVAFSAVRVPVSNASVAGTGTVTQVYSIGFYSNNASTLSLMNAVYGGMYITQGSVTAVTYSVWTASTGSNSAGGSGGFAGIIAASITSTSGNFSGYLQGVKNLDFPLVAATTYTIGNYWCAVAFCSTSLSSALWTNAGIWQSNAISSACLLDFGVNTASTLASLYGWGVISTTFTSQSSAATWFPLPNSVAVSNMNTTNSSGQRFHIPILRNV